MSGVEVSRIEKHGDRGRGGGKSRRGRVLLLLLLAAAVAFVSIAGAAIARPETGPPPDRYIVVFEEGVSPGAATAALARAHGIQVARTYSAALNGFAGRVPAARVEKLRSDPRVRIVEPDLVVTATEQIIPTGVDRIEADANYIANIDGQDDRVPVTVAVIDSGIDLDHPDLNVSSDERGLNISLNSYGGSATPDDENGHGTHVAGTIGALDNSRGVVGVAPGVELVSVRVMGPEGTGYLSDMIAGIDHVTAHADEIAVANMSLGRIGVSYSFHTAIRNSVAAGVVYTASAGNGAVDIYGADGVFGGGDDMLPAAYPEVAAISALADSDGTSGGLGGDIGGQPDDSFAHFSNYSTAVVAGNPVDSPGGAIDLLLPGVGIYSTYKDGGYAWATGTSMAAPHAAGLAALYVAENGRDADGDGNLDADDVYAVRQALIDAGVAQSGTGGLSVLNDPDANAEPLGWAGPAASEEPPAEDPIDEDPIDEDPIDEDPINEAPIDEAPAVSWQSPKDAETLSDAVILQITASDTEDDTVGAGSLTVEWRMDDGSWQTASYDAGSGLYTSDWDTKTAAEGSHALTARAVDSYGNMSMALVEMSVSNPEDVPEADAEPMFPDTVGTWYEEYAQNMAQHEFMLGYRNGDFGGSDEITRAQFAVVMARMMGIAPDGTAPDGTASFSDMEGHWAEGHVAAMADAGIIQGRIDGTFDPGSAITRAQMAAMMGRALEHVGAGLDDAELTQIREELHEHLSDVEGHWAEDHIAHMYGLGITVGDSTGHFRPDEHTNRAQASAMLWRLYEGQLQ